MRGASVGAGAAARGARRARRDARRDADARCCSSSPTSTPDVVARGAGLRLPARARRRAVPAHGRAALATSPRTARRGRWSIAVVAGNIVNAALDSAADLRRRRSASLGAATRDADRPARDRSRSTSSASARSIDGDAAPARRRAPTSSQIAQLRLARRRPAVRRGRHLRRRDGARRAPRQGAGGRAHDRAQPRELHVLVRARRRERDERARRPRGRRRRPRARAPARPARASASGSA